MATDVLTTITLPGQHSMPSQVEGWACPGCGVANPAEDWSTTAVYQPRDFIDEMTNLVNNQPLVVGEEQVVIDWMKEKVIEEEYERCPSCGNTFPADDLATEYFWNCGDCSTSYDTSHEALTCCLGECSSLHDYDHCTHRDGIRRNSNQHPLQCDHVYKDFFFCYCAEDDRCGYLVCLVCHLGVPMTEPSKWENHRCPGSPVRGTDCSCGSEFCCETHGTHVRPHLLCSLAS